MEITLKGRVTSEPLYHKKAFRFYDGFATVLKQTA